MSASKDEPIQAFVFIGQVPVEELERILATEGGGVTARWRSKVVGRFQGFQAIEAATLREIRDHALGLAHAAGTDVELHVEVGATAKGLKRGVTRAYGAIVRIQAERGRALEVRDTLLAKRTADGASVVTGSADVLAEINADSLADVERGIIALGDIEGILDTESLLFTSVEG